MADLELYAYQKEVVERALKGENVIIWLPTGGGKTRAAVYVAKKHLETKENAKVMVLVNTVPLVDQHYNNEFEPHLGDSYRIGKVSGECEEKDFFGKVVESRDVIICTAQIFHNALINDEETKHVELSDITLLIIDECHHTHKEAVYNKVMRCYVEKKLKGEKPLPQILGLTASPGTGGAKVLELAVDHVLEICANLDSSIVSTKVHYSELMERVNKPKKRFNVVEKRPADPFGDHLKRMMALIHQYMELPSDSHLGDFGTQQYEANVVKLEKHGVGQKNRVTSQCARHLKEYNDALLINDTLQMMDAYRSLEEYYLAEIGATIDQTDVFLAQLFEQNQEVLKTCAADLTFENPKMAMLQSILLKQFGSGLKARGILFCKTRKSAHCLNDWVLNNEMLQAAGIKAAILTGAGNGLTHMTKHEQEDTIRNFRTGQLNLLISTSVAEEGLDIPECNLVVRYGLLTNEIAQQQSGGRARAKNSQYSVVAQAGGQEIRREQINEHLEELTGKAVERVQSMSQEQFLRKINALQTRAINLCRILEEQRAEKKKQSSPSEVQILCRYCFKIVAFASDIKLIENMHHVNVNPNFKQHYQLGEEMNIPKSFENWEPGCAISCSHCDKKWGHEIKYKKLFSLPNLGIKNFTFQITPNETTPIKKWKDVPFTIEDFSLEEYCQENLPDLFE